jgi:hypothetical protein
MSLTILLLTLAFVHPKIQPAKPGTEQPEGNYVVAQEGVYKLDRGKVLRVPKKFHPAFVFSAEDHFKIGFKPAESGGTTILSADGDQLMVRYSDGFVVHKGSATALTKTHEIESIHALVVEPGKDEYLLIRWTDACPRAFTLFKVDGDTIKEVATNHCAH